MATPTLDLSTFIDRPALKIDGQLYELRHSKELSVVDGALLRKWWGEMDAIESALKDVTDPPTAEQMAESTRYRDIISKFVTKVTVDLPAEVLSKLSGEDLAAIVFHFLGLPQRALIAEALQAMKALASQSARSTGEPSSHG